MRGWSVVQRYFAPVELLHDAACRFPEEPVNKRALLDPFSPISLTGPFQGGACSKYQSVCYFATFSKSKGIHGPWTSFQWAGNAFEEYSLSKYECPVHSINCATGSWPDCCIVSFQNESCHFSRNSSQPWQFKYSFRFLTRTFAAYLFQLLQQHRCLQHHRGNPFPLIPNIPKVPQLITSSRSRVRCSIAFVKCKCNSQTGWYPILGKEFVRHQSFKVV